MTAIKWVLWLGIAWAVFFAYCAIDVPTLIHQKWGH